MKTTKREFELFKKRCLEWQAKLGLMQWSLYFAHDNLEDAYARTGWSTQSMVATIQFTRRWDDTRPKSATELNKLALHEVLHVLLAPLASEAMFRYSTDDAIQSAEHAIVRTLENTLI